MKSPFLLLTFVFLAGCTSPSDDANAPASITPATPSAAVPTAEAPAKMTKASANGVVEAVDTAARTITIAHGPIDALQWPAMTMTFKAPDADLSAIKKGDHVAFEFTSTGMNGTITTITRQ